MPSVGSCSTGVNERSLKRISTVEVPVQNPPYPIKISKPKKWIDIGNMGSHLRTLSFSIRVTLAITYI